MRLATYNIKHGSTRGLPAIAATLQPLQADLVALQEVDVQVARSGDVDQARWLGEQLGMEPVFGRAFDLEGGQYGVALLTRLAVTGSRTVLLPSISSVPLADGVEPRVLLEVDLAPGFTVAVTHFGLSARERLEQAAALLDRAPVRTLLAGDFNEGPGAPGFSRLLATFTDCLEEAGLRERATFPSQAPVQAIDHVLRTADLPPTRSARRVPSGASDHLPLVVDFVIRLTG